MCCAFALTVRFSVGGEQEPFTSWKGNYDIISGSFQWHVLKCIFPVSRFMRVIRSGRKEKEVCNLGKLLL